MVKNGVSEYNELCDEIFHKRATMALHHAIAFAYLALAALALTYTFVGFGLASSPVGVGNSP